MTCDKNNLKRIQKSINNNKNNNQNVLFYFRTIRIFENQH